MSESVDDMDYGWREVIGMATAEATLPVMRDSQVGMHDFPDHANVLAVVDAYTSASGRPLPYVLLLDIMESLPGVDSEAAIPHASRIGVVTALHNIVADLRRLDLIEMGSAGTELTLCGRQRLEAWNGQFKARSKQAQAAMVEAGFLAE